VQNQRFPSALRVFNPNRKPIVFLHSGHGGDRIGHGSQARPSRNPQKQGAPPNPRVCRPFPISGGSIMGQQARKTQGNLESADRAGKTYTPKPQSKPRNPSKSS